MCLFSLNVKVTSRTFGVDRFIDVPCGHCIECLKRRQNDWKLRICNEANNWSHFYFFTLTYRDEMLPCNVHFRDTLDDCLFAGRLPDCKAFIEKHKLGDEVGVFSTALRADIQKWLKRMRVRYERINGECLRMKYFICSEYGPNPRGTKRPHYHGVIMTDAVYNDLLPAFNEWFERFGRMEFKEVGINREDKSSVANYVSKYCAKGEFESRREDIEYGFIEKAWIAMSKNIGAGWAESLRKSYLHRYPHAFSVDGSWSYDDIDRSYHKHFFNGKTTDPAWRDIQSLCDDLYVYDGKNHKYKMPRYIRERIFYSFKTYINYDTTNEINLHIFTGEGNVKSRLPYYSAPFPITFKSKVRKDKRYVSETFVSAAVAYLLCLRTAALDWERFCNFRKRHLGLSYVECFRKYSESQDAAKLCRQSVAKSSLSNFYTSNMWSHREFDE